jgi:hypothetical protein
MFGDWMMNRDAREEDFPGVFFYADVMVGSSSCSEWCSSVKGSK